MASMQGPRIESMAACYIPQAIELGERTFSRMALTSHPLVRRCDSKAGSSCRIFAAIELLSRIRHQTEPSIGPGRTAGLKFTGMSFSIAASRFDDSADSAVKCARAGESCVA